MLSLLLPVEGGGGGGEGKVRRWSGLLFCRPFLMDLDVLFSDRAMGLWVCGTGGQVLRGGWH